GRELPGKGRQQVALQRELLFERRKQLFNRSESRFLRKDVRPRRLTQTELTFENIEKVLLDRDDPLGRRDLATERCLLNGGGHDIARERKIGGLELEQLLLRHGVKVLDRPEVGA